MTDIQPTPRGFLSSSSRDTAIAAAVVAALEARGLPIFYAPRDIAAGHNYKSEIMLALRDCTVLVVLLSPTALASVHVSREVTKAVEKDKQILPFALPGVEPGDFDCDDEWSYLFSGVQVVTYLSPSQVADAVLQVVTPTHRHRPPIPTTTRDDEWPAISVERFTGIVNSIVQQRSTVTPDEYSQLIGIARTVESAWLSDKDLDKFVTTCLTGAGVTGPNVSPNGEPMPEVDIDDHRRSATNRSHGLELTEQQPDTVAARHPRRANPDDAQEADDGDADESANGPKSALSHDPVLNSVIEILAPVMNKHWHGVGNATDGSLDKLHKTAQKNLRSWEDLGGRTKGGRTGRWYAGSGGLQGLANEMEEHRRGCSHPTQPANRRITVYAEQATADFVNASDAAADQLEAVSVEDLRAAEKSLAAHLRIQSNVCEHQQRALARWTGYVLAYFINGRT